MPNIKLSGPKVLFLWLVILVYVISGVTTYSLLAFGIISPAIPLSDATVDFGEATIGEAPYRLEIAKAFVNQQLVASNGHINLTFTRYGLHDDNTNSEAVSYYLLWNALGRHKQSFEKELTYARTVMAHPQEQYLMWRLNARDVPVDDGSNIATDADLRALRALYAADAQWDNENYTVMIHQLASALERIAITNDFYFAPYGGVSGSTLWKTEEVWLSYADFEAFALLAQHRRGVWNTVYHRMKDAIIHAQLPNGLYNSALDDDRLYTNMLDAGNYSINSLWVMVRSAESDDADLRTSAQKSLDFYKASYKRDGLLYTSYSGVGLPASQDESPWVYALVGRAAIHLGDKKFSEQMISELLSFQNTDEESAYFGAFVEGSDEQPFASQFTIQESILTLQQYLELSKIEGN